MNYQSMAKQPGGGIRGLDRGATPTKFTAMSKVLGSSRGSEARPRVRGALGCGTAW